MFIPKYAHQPRNFHNVNAEEKTLRFSLLQSGVVYSSMAIVRHPEKCIMIMMSHRMYLVSAPILVFAMFASLASAMSQGLTLNPLSPDGGAGGFVRAPRLYDESRFQPGEGPLSARPDSLHDAAPSRSVLRAGLVIEDVNEPGKIKAGEVVWILKPGVRSANAEVRLGKGQGEFDFDVTPSATDGQIRISVRSRVGAAIPKLSEVEVPRVRRPGSLQGEPLLGRVREGGDGVFIIELSQDPIDLKNNLSRLLNREWLDFHLRDVSGVETVLTVEIGKDGRKMLQTVLAR